MARTRQKSKQRQAKRREKQPSAPQQANAATDAARSEAAAQGDTSPPAELAAEEIAPAAPARAKPEPAAKPKPARSEKPREKRPERPRDTRAERKAQPRRRGRITSFFVQVWAELRRVQWPTRSQVTQATAVVVVFCFLAGGYLAIWDFVFNRLVKALL